MNFEAERIKTEKAFLVGAELRGSRPLLSLEDSLSELGLLADTAGMTVVGHTTQTLNSIDPATYIGSGKVQEIISSVQELEADTVIFDDELSPRHERELSKLLGEKIKLLDRSSLILDIFAQHAKTREGALQVELAQYEYRLPRLTRQWTHLARQAGGSAASGGVGGVGLRGPGETQLEVDRREISRKISKLKEDIEKVRQHRQQHRNQRKKSAIPLVALVGYTNAGKSTLLNTLTNSDVYVANQLFATLDPTTRKVALPSGREVLFSDTVGFIQKLPTTLVAAFRATLEEIFDANLILHVVDMSHPQVESHIEAVEDTLAEIDLPDIPRLMIWNKLDQFEGDNLPEIVDDQIYAGEIRVSARNNQNIDQLLELIDTTLSASAKLMHLLIPHDRGDLISYLFTNARVLSQDHISEGVLITAEMPERLVGRFQEFQFEGADNV